MRKRPRKEPHPEVYALKVEGLRLLEQMSEQGLMDLYYGDESRVSLQPCVPYAWQFKGEDAFMPSTQGRGLNCFALLCPKGARAPISVALRPLTTPLMRALSWNNSKACPGA